MNRFYVFDTEDFNARYYYGGDDLGFVWTTKQTTFKLWAPMADECNLILYADGYLGGPYKNIPMEYEKGGVWSVVVKGNLNSFYYNFEVKYDNQWNEVTDPYAKATGVNGKRCMIVNFESLNSRGWEEDKQRERIPPDKAIIYEGHIRDLTINESSGVTKKGMYLGLAERNTVNSYSMPTGLSHIASMGVTHIHLLPINDFGSVDEMMENRQYNWGYDPVHFSTPEGSYSTNPYRGSVRIKELKKMIRRIHKEGLNVILDVVYNHTYYGVDGDLYKVFPGFYYRSDSVGNLTNGSGCGNELATERKMVRKYIVDSLKFWVEEYHVDGFRFDLMGLYDIETLNYIRSELDKIDPNIITYGEPWQGAESALTRELAGTKNNMRVLPDNFAAFSDDFRDAIKGDVFDAAKPGFVQGDINCRETVKMGITGAVGHHGVALGYLTRHEFFMTKNPMQSINYTSAHDNLTLYDKLIACEPDASIERIKKLVKLCAAITLTSQGIPFFSAGEEFLRTKNGDHNSYKSSDEINGIDWNRMKTFEDVTEYYKGLIKLRKRHPAFRMKTTEEIRENIKFIDTDNNNIITYIIQNHANGDAWKEIVVIFNISSENILLGLPSTGWNIVVNGDKAGTDLIEYIEGDSVEVGESEVLILTH